VVRESQALWCNRLHYSSLNIVSNPNTRLKLRIHESLITNLGILESLNLAPLTIAGHAIHGFEDSMIDD